MNKKILIISYSNLSSDPRIQRQIKALKTDFQIEVLGSSNSGDSSIPYHPIYKEPPFSLKRKLKRLIQFITHQFDDYYWDSGKINVVEHLRKNSYAAIVANDIQALPLALAIANVQSNVYFDAHEYHPREFEDLLRWRLFHKPYIEFLCKKFIPQASAFSTVSENIALEYANFIGKKPFVITNATDYQELMPTINNSHTIRIIHHTAAIRSRKIELMIETMNFLDNRFELDLILVGTDLTYIDELKKLANGKTNIRFLPPVPYKDICHFINAYDIGLFLLPPTNFNYLNSLPNKFFEFVQARLALAVSPNPEMSYLLKKYDLGVVADDYSAIAMADALKKITKEKIIYYKKQSELHARTLSAEDNMKKINLIVSNLVNKK
jgi:glycosyltransferase involved in cell wall biosynthesis